MSEEMIHFWDLSKPGDLGACGLNLATLPLADYYATNVWERVTCVACLRRKAGPFADLLAEEAPAVRRARLIAECSKVEEEALAAIADLGQMMARAIRLRTLLEQKPALGGQGTPVTPQGFLETLRPFAATQRGVAQYGHKPLPY